MKLITFLAGLLITSALQAETAPNADNGRKLFQESRCLSCHCLEHLTSTDDNEINNLIELESKVRQCDTQLSINWFDDQILDVVAYLNQEYYKFEIPDQAENNAVEEGFIEQPETVASAEKE